MKYFSLWKHRGYGNTDRFKIKTYFYFCRTSSASYPGLDSLVMVCCYNMLLFCCFFPCLYSMFLK
jgi:hypothetical protein